MKILNAETSVAAKQSIILKSSKKKRFTAIMRQIDEEVLFVAQLMRCLRHKSRYYFESKPFQLIIVY